MCDYMKVARGQVFWFDPAIYHIPEEIVLNGNRIHTNLQLYNRPYLVVGSTIHDQRLASIAPITSSISRYMGNPCCVECKLPGSEHSMILLNRIITIDSILLTDYICTLTPETLAQVDVAMAVQFGLPINQQSLDIDSVISKLQGIIGEIVNSKLQRAKAASKTEIENAALNLAANFESLIKDVKIPTVDVGKAVTSLKREVEASSTEYASSNESARTKKGKWSSAQKKEFLEDYENLTMDEMMIKYNYGTVKAIYSRAYALRRELKWDKK